MKKFINGRNGELTPEYREAYDRLRSAFSRIVEYRKPHYTRVQNIFDNKPETLGIGGVTNLPAKKQRDLLQHILIVEKMQYNEYVNVCNLVSGGNTHSEALNLLLVYMGAQYYYRDSGHKVQTIQQYAESWMYRYSHGHDSSYGLVVDYKLTPRAKYSCWLLIKYSSHDYTYDEKTGDLTRHYNEDGTPLMRTGLRWQYKSMEKVERDRVKSRTIISTTCASCHHVRTDIVVSRAYLAQYGLPIGYQFCTECGQKSCSMM